jgi:uncharacterized protein DUF3422
MAHSSPGAAEARDAAAAAAPAPPHLPPDHPQRAELNDEVHARPPEALAAPVRVSYLALLYKPVDKIGCDARRHKILGHEAPIRCRMLCYP